MADAHRHRGMGDPGGGWEWVFVSVAASCTGLAAARSEGGRRLLLSAFAVGFLCWLGHRAAHPVRPGLSGYALAQLAGLLALPFVAMLWPRLRALLPSRPWGIVATAAANAAGVRIAAGWLLGRGPVSLELLAWEGACTALLGLMVAGLSVDSSLRQRVGAPPGPTSVAGAGCGW